MSRGKRLTMRLRVPNNELHKLVKSSLIIQTLKIRDTIRL